MKFPNRNHLYLLVFIFYLTNLYAPQGSSHAPGVPPALIDGWPGFHKLQHKSQRAYKLKSGPGNNSTVAVVFCHCSSENYNPMIIGLDYTYNADFKVYRQALYQVVLRAKKLGKKRVNLGFSAGIEKKKLGALSSSIYAFMQTRDSYHAAILASMQVASQTK